MRALATLAVVCVTLLASTVSFAQAAPQIEVTKLTEKLHLLATDQGEYTTNTLAFVGDDGILLVDTQSAEYATELQQVVAGFGKGTPKYIINTHRHVEHIGGNAVFGGSPVIIAHELVPQKLRSGSYIFDEFPDETYPDITLRDSLTLFFNGEKIEIIAMPGSHDDNEIIVHFTESKIVHLSSLVNGFNFPSVDSAGDVLKFAELVARAIEILPEDVSIVSGHNAVGSWKELDPYHDMLLRSTELVRQGLANGKDLATLQQDGLLAEWEKYAGSYVSVDEWTEYLVDGLQAKAEPSKTVFEPLYYLWKSKGAEAAVAHYRELKRDHPDEYSFNEFGLLIIGGKLLDKQHFQAAISFLEASLEEYPDSKYGYYSHFRLAGAFKELGVRQTALTHCKKALELKPEFEPAAELLAELE